jgi:ABC-type sugar transport system substrate-binding protein
MNRKSIGLLLAFVTWFLLLTGCSAQTGQSGSGTGATNETAQEEAEEITSGLPSEAKIGVVYARDIGTFSERFTGRLKGYLIQAGVSEDKIIERAVSAEELPDAVKDLVDEKCTVLVVDNAGDIPISSITDRASKAGIPILYFGMDPGEKERARWEKKGIKAAYVGGDDTKAAQMRADVLDKMDFSLIDLNEDREIGTIVIRDSDGSDAERINQETLKALEERHYTVNILDKDENEEDDPSGEETDDTQVVDEPEEEEAEDGSPDGEDPEAASEEPHEAIWEVDASPEEIEKEATYELVISKMEEYGGDLELILCANDSQAAGAWKAVSEEKRLVGHDVLILGLGAGEETLQEVARGNITGTLFNNSMEQAKCAADYTISYIKGIDVPYYTAFDFVNVTVDNAQEILDILSLQSGSGSTGEETADEEASLDDAEEDSE